MLRKLYITRREEGMTQDQVAKLLNIHRDSYSHKEKCNTPLTLVEAYTIAQRFNMSLDELFEEDMKRLKKAD